MSIREIPKSFVYECDGEHCSSQHIQEGADGYYTNSTPPKWMRLKIDQKEYLVCPHHSAILGAKFTNIFGKVKP